MIHQDNVVLLVSLAVPFFRLCGLGHVYDTGEPALDRRLQICPAFNPACLGVPVGVAI